MRKYFELPMILALLCLSASAQTPKACQDQLRHFTVPEYPKAFSAHHGSVKLPSRLLFSDKGIEVYADTFPDGRDSFANKAASDLGILVVYQDEVARQAMIAQMRDKHMLPPSGLGALPENFKYAVIHFSPESLIPGHPETETWDISQIEFDQPKECMNVFQNDDHASPYNAYTGYVGQVAQSNPLKSLRLKMDASAAPLYRKGLQTMLAWVKECESLVDTR